MTTTESPTQTASTSMHNQGLLNAAIADIQQRFSLAESMRKEAERVNALWEGNEEPNRDSVSLRHRASNMSASAARDFGSVIHWMNTVEDRTGFRHNSIGTA